MCYGTVRLFGWSAWSIIQTKSRKSAHKYCTCTTHRFCIYSEFESDSALLAGIKNSSPKLVECANPFHRYPSRYTGLVRPSCWLGLRFCSKEVHCLFVRGRDTRIHPNSQRVLGSVDHISFKRENTRTLKNAYLLGRHWSRQNQQRARNFSRERQEYRRWTWAQA